MITITKATKSKSKKLFLRSQNWFPPCHNSLINLLADCGWWALIKIKIELKNICPWLLNAFQMKYNHQIGPLMWPMCGLPCPTFPAKISCWGPFHLGFSQSDLSLSLKTLCSCLPQSFCTFFLSHSLPSLTFPLALCHIHPCASFKTQFKQYFSRKASKTSVSATPRLLGS